MSLLLACRFDQLQVLALDIGEAFWVVVIGGMVPVALVKILLQPGRAIEALSMNGLDFRTQHGPFRVRVMTELGSGQ